MFPEINHLHDLLPAIAGNEQMRVKTDELTGHTVVCYMVQDDDTFAGEHHQYERECRGITFAADGKISSRHLHKFFNIGEREDTQPHSICWADVIRIMPKRDGSMVTPVLTPGETSRFKFKTKKSFSTPEAALADELASGAWEQLWIANLLEAGLTPIFEVTSPRFPIVVCYEKDELTLLHIRENDTGRYLTEEELIFLDSPFPTVPNLIEQFYGDGVPAKLVSWEKLKAYASYTVGTEGLVIQFKDGEMVKLKTAWYVKLHHAVTFVRWRDIARAVCADKADDLKGAFALCGRAVTPIVHVENEIKQQLKVIQDLVKLYVSEGHERKLTPKDMALIYKDVEHFGLIMRAFRNHYIDWFEFYEKHHLDQKWNLEVVPTV